MKFKRFMSWIIALACVGAWVLPGIVVSVSAASYNLINVSGFEKTIDNANYTVVLHSPIYDTYYKMFTNGQYEAQVIGDSYFTVSYASEVSERSYQNFAQFPSGRPSGDNLYYFGDILSSDITSIKLSIPISINSLVALRVCPIPFFYDSDGNRIYDDNPSFLRTFSGSSSVVNTTLEYSLIIPSGAVSFGLYVSFYTLTSAWKSGASYQVKCNSFDITLQYADSIPDIWGNEDVLVPAAYSSNISEMKVLETDTSSGTDVTYAFEGSHYYYGLKNSDDLYGTTKFSHSGSPLELSTSYCPMMNACYQPTSSYCSYAGITGSEYFYVGDLPLDYAQSAEICIPYEILDSGTAYTGIPVLEFLDSSGEFISSASFDSFSINTSPGVLYSDEYTGSFTFPDGTEYLRVRFSLVAKAASTIPYEFSSHGFSLKISYSDSFSTNSVETIDVSSWACSTDLSDVTSSGGYAYDHYSCNDYKALIQYGSGDPVALLTSDHNVGTFEDYKWRIPLIVTNEYYELDPSSTPQAYDISNLWNDDVVLISAKYDYVLYASDSTVDLSLGLYGSAVDEYGNLTGTLWFHQDGLVVGTNDYGVSGSIECNLGTLSTHVDSLVQCWLDVTRSTETSDGRPIIQIKNFEFVVMRSPVASEIPEETEPPTEPTEPSSGSVNVDLSGVEDQLEDMSGSISSGFAGVHDDIADLGDDITSGFDDVESAIGDLDSSLNQGLDDLGQEIGEDLDDLEATIDQGLSEVESAIGDTNEKIEESNGLLGNVVEGITSLPQKLLDGIIGLFVPSEEDMQAYNDKWDELLRSRFGALYESVDLIDEYANTMEEKAATNTVQFPSVTLDLAGVPFTFGGWDVRVVPEGFDAVFDMLKWMISIIATLGMINALRNKFERLLGGV